MLLSFKTANSVDSAAVYSLIRNIYEQTPYFSDKFDHKYPTTHSFKNAVENLFSISGSHFDLIYVDSKMAGYFQIERRTENNLAHTGYLNMGILPQFQGMKLGRELLQRAWSLIESEKYLEILYLMVRSDNEPAIKLYRSSGFEDVAVLKNDTKTSDGRYYDGILMRKYTKNFKQ